MNLQTEVKNGKGTFYCDVRQYIAGCDSCSKIKSDTVTKGAPIKIVHSRYPVERIAIFSASCHLRKMITSTFWW